MNISKVRNFNNYFQNVVFGIVLFTLSLVPWVEFINVNFDEVDFIFNNNFLILLILYFVLISLIFVILKYFSYLNVFSLVSLITISIWILFQHNFLKSNIQVFLRNLNISDVYSSELGLIFVIIMIYIASVLIRKKKFFANFFILFLTFNLCFSIYIFANKFYK